MSFIVLSVVMMETGKVSAELSYVFVDKSRSDNSAAAEMKKIDGVTMKSSLFTANSREYFPLRKATHNYVEKVESKYSGIRISRTSV